MKADLSIIHVATLRLFGAVCVSTKSATETGESTGQGEAQNLKPVHLSDRTLRNGYALQPAIPADDINDELLDIVDRVIGLSGEKANAAFHKSWTHVQDTDIETLVLQQIVHYLTTYGFQQAGIYHEDTVYIPHEQLDIPELESDIPLTVVKAMTADEIREGVIRLSSGIALSQSSLDNIMQIVRGLSFDLNLIDQVKNRELRTLLYDHFGIAPIEPVEFLRYLVAMLTGESLLIKNDALLEKITGPPPDDSKTEKRKFLRRRDKKTKPPPEDDRKLNAKELDALLELAPANLASIFFRYKPIFLALKKAASNKNFFNRLRKQANKLHQPQPADFLNSVTASIKHHSFDLQQLEKRLHHSTIWRKIRLAYALHFRLNSGDSTVYRVRNGRGWATEFQWENSLRPVTAQAYQTVLNSIVEQLRPHVSGRLIHIPDNVCYTLPATEKMFTGYWPTGSYITAPDHLIVGIHWSNTTRSIDLDLSVMDEDGKLGWDAGYRSDDRSVLFSGDMTDAPKPKGATELFCFKQAGKPKIMMVNYYNFRGDDPVDCRILVAHETPKSFGMNYMVDPNKVIASATITISQKQNVLGLVANVDGKNRVYFANTSVGSSISASKKSPHTAHAREFLLKSLVSSIELADVLQQAGAKITNVRPEEPDSDFVDLAPTALTKTTFMNLLQQNETKQ